MNKLEVVKNIAGFKERYPEADFALIGTLNLFLQGLDFEPRDVDFLTNDSFIDRLAIDFKAVVKEDCESGYKEVEIDYEGEEYHFVSYVNNPVRKVDLQADVVTVDYNGILLPCMNLLTEYKAYSKMNRDKDQDKIKALAKKLKIT